MAIQRVEQENRLKTVGIVGGALLVLGAAAFGVLYLINDRTFQDSRRSLPSGTATLGPTSTPEPIRTLTATATAGAKSAIMAPSSTPQLDVFNPASNPKNCPEPPAFGLCFNVNPNQGENQGTTAWEGLQTSVSFKNAVTESAVLLGSRIGTQNEPFWISHGVMSDTLNITDVANVRFVKSDDKTLNLEAPKDERKDVMVVTKAADVIKTMNTQVRALTNAQKGNEEFAGEAAYYQQYSQNWIDFSRKLGVRLLDKDGRDYEPEFANRADVEATEKMDFKVGLLTRGLDGNKNFANPIESGVIEIYRVKPGNQTDIPVKTWKEVYRLDTKSGKWVFDKSIPVGDVAVANKDSATLVFVSSWRRYQAQNVLQLRAMLIAQNEFSQLGKNGAMEKLYGLYPTGPLPGWKQTIQVSRPTATATWTPSPTASRPPGGPPENPPKETPQKTPMRPTATPQNTTSPGLPPTFTPEPRITPPPLPSDMPTPIHDSSPVPTQKPRGTSQPATPEPPSTPDQPPTAKP